MFALMKTELLFDYSDRQVIDFLSRPDEDDINFRINFENLGE